MQIEFITQESLTEFLTLVSRHLGLTIQDSGQKVELQKGDHIKIEAAPEKTVITYGSKPQLFRALTMWQARQKQEPVFSCEETPRFDKIGPMIDLSRNAVLTVAAMKEYITLSAKMGLNSVMLYMEDTYEIPEYPYFGHMRGRYSQQEMKALDDFAYELGVELIPSIQTLGHLRTPLRWNFAIGMKDTHDILLVDEDKTYTFIEAMIRSVSNCFRSRQIHIGMDEAHDLGLGHYLGKHGLENRFSIMTKHLNRVVPLCERYGMKAMMWSDMFFRIGTKSGDYYDPEVDFPQELIDDMPDVDMVYWDYYHHDEEKYAVSFANHKKLQRPIIFAGGVWTWNGLAPNYGKSLATTAAGLTAAKKSGIREVYATLWGDDGQETPHVAALLGLQQFAEEQYGDAPTIDLISDRFEMFHGQPATDFLLLDRFDQTPGVAKDNPGGSNVSKLALYEDLLFGIYDGTLNQYDLKDWYRRLAQDLTTVQPTATTAPLFAFYQQLAEVLAQKAPLGKTAWAAYQAQDREALAAVLAAITALKPELEKLHEAHRAVWFQWNKPFGWEILELRYGGLIKRAETSAWRLDQYLAGTLDELPELTAPRLPFDGPWLLGEDTVGRNLFHGIYSASKLSDV